MTPFRWQMAAGAALVALLSAACGGGGGDSGTSTPQAIKTVGGAAVGSGKCPAAAGLGDTVKDHGTLAASGSAVALEAGDSFFAPTCLTGVPAGKVSVTVKNTGSALHNFSIPDQGIDVDVAAGKSITVQVEASSGSTIFHCKYHRASGMVGALLQAPG